MKSSIPAWNTGCLRYDFQIACVKQAIDKWKRASVRTHTSLNPFDSARKLPRLVLNIGCNEDPAELRKRFGAYVCNCDRSGYDDFMNRPNVVDKIFDCLEFPWPFEDDSVELVVFGDILEHFPVEKSVQALKEARRVARQVCVTVPEDTRIDEAAEQEKWTSGVYNLHTTIITEQVLQGMLSAAGWGLLDWLVGGLWGIGGDWGEKGINGWCARAHGGDFATGGVVKGPVLRETSSGLSCAGVPLAGVEGVDAYLADLPPITVSTHGSQVAA